MPQLGLILVFWLVGELITYLLKSSISGSIVGMVLLTLSLEFKLIKLNQIENVADFLIRNMAFFFIPPGVGLMVNLELIANNWIAITIATFLSTVLVLWSTAMVAQIGRKKPLQGFPGDTVVENLPANAGDTGSSPGLGRSHMPRSN